jgi:hypothetical protein
MEQSPSWEADTSSASQESIYPGAVPWLSLLAAEARVHCQASLFEIFDIGTDLSPST